MASDRKIKPLPKGEGLVWSVIGTLVSGPLVWGLLGAFLDSKFETEPIYLVSGLILGFVMSMYIVYVRYGRE